MSKRSRNGRGISTRVRDSESWLEQLIPGQVEKENRAGERTAQVSVRILFISAIIVVSLVALIARLFYMQVVDAEGYYSLANGNRVRLEVEYAPRGNILDRKGNVIADNTSSFQLTLTPYLMNESPKERTYAYRTISNVLDKKPAEIKKLAMSKGEDFVQPLVIAEKLTHDQARRLEAAASLDGFSIDAIPIRNYDSRGGLAHVVGYSGRVNEREVEADNKLLPADFIGKSGIELQYDSILRGQNGWQRIEVDALGRPVRVLAKQEPVAGKDITLTIDRDLQIEMMNAVQEQMSEAKVSKASGVAVHPQTGEVLAIISVPYYDNNLFAAGISQEAYSSLINEPNQPLYNKAISGGFSSGSTIKPVVASAALQEGVVNENTIINDVSAIVLPGGFSFASWRPGGLGPMNIRRAIAWSSNIYFYTVGGGHGGIEGLGHPRLQQYYRQFGFGELSGIDIPNEVTGRVPDEKWKMQQTGEGWYIGDSYNISIGQGDFLLSPLQLAMAHSTIANDGYLLAPYVNQTKGRKQRREVSINKDYLKIVQEGMRQVLTGGTTCECTFKDVPVNVAGKSGTAETNPESGKRPHAWYSAFAPYESPEILVTVLLEEGVGGSQFAAPAINTTMAHYFNNQ